MNYGRFFKLNQKMSSLVNGVTIFDYTELPAFEGRPIDTPVSMSPRYPISVSITSNAVRFNMHYCVYRGSKIVIQQPHNQQKNEKHQLQHISQHNDSDYCLENPSLPECIRKFIGLKPIYKEIDTGIIVYGGGKPTSPTEPSFEQIEEPVYGFSIDDIRRKLNQDNPNMCSEHDEINVVHMEEVILELPFSGIEASNLTNIIKNSYIAAFPQVAEMGEIEIFQGNDVTDKRVPIFTGNQYLKKLIKERILGKEKNPDAISFSTLWLMDLYQKDEIQEGGRNKKNDIINLCSNNHINQLIDKFMRKLLLDFMFDLKHSDLFQLCPKYDQMYSGLMSNFYFSALMHKCEYYYYRDLTTQAIKDQEKKKQEKEIGRYDEKKIIYLYAKELFDAEEQWANDIRNPLSDINFEKDFPNDYSKSGKSRWEWGRIRTEFASAVWERMTNTRWDSWFASPEEEMRRIYFLSKVDNQQTICNSVSLIEYLHLHFNHKNDSDAPIKETLISLARDSRGKSSKWFLNRYDYNDAMHLHLFRSSNLLFMITAIILIVLLFFHTSSEGGTTLFSNIVGSISLEYGVNLLLALPIFVGILVFVFYRCTPEQTSQNDHHNPLVPSYCHYAFKKLMIAIISITFFVSTLFLIVIIIRSGDLSNCIIRIKGGKHLILIAAWFLMVLFFAVNYIFTRIFISHKRYSMSASIHPIKSWHMFLPKLTASIIAAWIPLTTGFTHYKGFLQSHISIYILITIVLVVIVFFIYQVDHDCPSCSSGVKVLRSFEQLLISFCISLAIGAICLLLKKEGTLKTSMLIEVYNIKIWIKLSAIAMFTGLFLNAIFRPKNHMTDI